MDAQLWSQVGKVDAYVYTTVYVPDLAFKKKASFKFHSKLNHALNFEQYQSQWPILGIIVCSVELLFN